MSSPPGWNNSIRVLLGQSQAGIDARSLLPSRSGLSKARLDQQRLLRQSHTARSTPIQATVDGVIWDGHHAVRAAAEASDQVDVLVVAIVEAWSGMTIVQLPVR